MHATRTLKKGLLIATAACGLTLVPAMASATQGIWTLTEDTTLTEDHYGTIRPNGFRLECDMYGIYNGTQGNDCDNGTKSCGINLQNSSRSTVRVCHIEGFDVGIFGDGGSAVNVDYGWIYHNGTGIYLRNWQGTADTAISRVHVYASRRIGIHLVATTDQRIEQSSIYSNGTYGIYTENDAYNAYGGTELLYNEITSHNGFGVYCRNNQFFRAYHNMMYENGKLARQDGLRLVTCDNFDIWDNQMMSNEDTGLFVYDSYYGTIRANIGRNNGSWDAYEESSVGNNWYSNSWDKTYPDGMP